MRKLLLCISFILFIQIVNAQQNATTDDGRKVVLNIDGTWRKKYDEKGQIIFLPNGAIDREYIPIDPAILTNLLAFCIVPNVTFIFIAFTLLRKQTNHNSTDQTCNSNNGFHHGPGFQSRFLINLKKGTDQPEA